MVRAELFILEYGTKKAAKEIRTAAEHLDNIATHMTEMADRLQKEWGK